MPCLQVNPPRELTIGFDDGRRFALHPIWLRERCRDLHSMDLRIGQRLNDPSDPDLALSVTSISEPEPGRYLLSFSDGHEGELPGCELLAEVVLPPAGQDIPAPRLCNAAMSEVRHYARTEQPAELQLHEWLRQFLEASFIVCSGVPIRPGALFKAGSTFGFTRETNFGRTGFDPAEGLRHLQGCYIDFDGPRGLYRVVRRRLAETQGV